MKIVIDLLLLSITLWSAHVAGAGYIQAKEDPSLKRGAILRTCISLAVGGLLIFRG